MDMFGAFHEIANPNITTTYILSAVFCDTLQKLPSHYTTRQAASLE